MLLDACFSGSEIEVEVDDFQCPSVDFDFDFHEALFAQGLGSEWDDGRF